MSWDDIRQAIYEALPDDISDRHLEAVDRAVADLETFGRFESEGGKA